MRVLWRCGAARDSEWMSDFHDTGVAKISAQMLVCLKSFIDVNIASQYLDCH